MNNVQIKQQTQNFKISMKRCFREQKEQPVGLFTFYAQSSALPWRAVPFSSMWSKSRRQLDAMPLGRRICFSDWRHYDYPELRALFL